MITMQSYAKKLLIFLLLVLLLVLRTHEDAASSQPKLWLLSQLIFALDYCITIVCLQVGCHKDLLWLVDIS